MRVVIQSGISIRDDGRFKFDRRADKATDILLLKEDTSDTENINGVKYIYGYHFNPNADLGQIKIFREALKYDIYDSNVFDGDVHSFIESGILKLNRYKKFDELQVMIDIHSTSGSDLVPIMRSYFTQYMKNRMKSFSLLKTMYKRVKFNEHRTKQALIMAGYEPDRIKIIIQDCVTNFNKLKGTYQLFQMKQIIPVELRSGFYDFLEFEDERQKTLYKTLQGIEVIIFDDFRTTGSTVDEVVRYLRSINPNNTLTVFVLIRQSK